MAACGARAAVGNARHWVHELTLAGGLGASPRGVSSRPERGRLHRRRECRYRVPLGAGRLQPPANARHRSREPPGKRNQRVRRSSLGPRGEARHLDHPDRVIVFRRYHRPSREFQPAGRQRNRFRTRDRSDESETPRAVARLGAGGPSLRSSRQSQLPCGGAPTAAARRGCGCDQSAALHSQSQHRPRIGRLVRIAKAGGCWRAAGRR